MWHQKYKQMMMQHMAEERKRNHYQTVLMKKNTRLMFAGYMRDTTDLMSMFDIPICIYIYVPRPISGTKARVPIVSAHLKGLLNSYQNRMHTCSTKK